MKNIGNNKITKRIYDFFNFIIRIPQKRDMRLQFELKQIKVDPTCHIQLTRHAEEYQNKNVTGLMYGALYDDQASVTSILPFPDSQSFLTREDIIPMERRHEQKLNQFNLDHENIGFYFISHHGNFWNELENVKLYEEYINTSFFLVYDYEARLEGRNPYKAFRLRDSFATTESFSWSDLEKINIQENNPFVEIPTVVQKNFMFQAMMLMNKHNFITNFAKKRAQMKKKNLFNDRIENYMESLDEHQEASKKLKDIERRMKKSEGKPIEKLPMSQFYEFLSADLKLQAKQQQFQRYRKNMEVLKKTLQ